MVGEVMTGGFSPRGMVTGEEGEEGAAGKEKGEEKERERGFFEKPRDFVSLNGAFLKLNPKSLDFWVVGQNKGEKFEIESFEILGSWVNNFWDVFSWGFSTWEFNSWGEFGKIRVWWLVICGRSSLIPKFKFWFLKFEFYFGKEEECSWVDERAQGEVSVL